MLAAVPLPSITPLGPGVAMQLLNWTPVACATPLLAHWTCHHHGWCVFGLQGLLRRRCLCAIQRQNGLSQHGSRPPPTTANGNTRTFFGGRFCNSYLSQQVPEPLKQTTTARLCTIVLLPLSRTPTLTTQHGHKARFVRRQQPGDVRNASVLGATATRIGPGTLWNFQIPHKRWLLLHTYLSRCPGHIIV